MGVSIAAKLLGIIIFVIDQRRMMALRSIEELQRHSSSLLQAEEQNVSEDQNNILAESYDGFGIIRFKNEKKIIVKKGVAFCSFSNHYEEYENISFVSHKVDDLGSYNSMPAFKEFWLNKSQDFRTSELVSKEDARENREYIRIETFLYIVGSRSRIKYQEKSFWLSDEGITITSKNVNVPPSSKEKTYIAEITLGEFELDKSGELCAVDKGVIRMKMTREGLDINDKNCSTGLTYINAKTSLEETLENEAQRIANKKAKPSAGQSKPSTNLEGMELRKRGGERS